MKIRTLLMTALVAAAGMIAVPDTLMAQQEKTLTLDGLTEFSTLEASGKIELAVTIDPTQPQAMTIEYNGNDQNKLKWWDKDGKLQIRFASSSKDQPIVVKLTCQQLTVLTLSKDASMTVATPWVQKMITVELSSDAKLTANIEATDIQLMAQTGAVAAIKGIATYAAFEGRTRASIDAVGCSAKSTEVRAAGYAECKAYGAERLVVNAVDGAKVFWRGTPEILRLHSSRGANIYPIGE
jgi:hypothetical protein